jgi:multimeric flavodoxin WrbA
MKKTLILHDLPAGDAARLLPSDSREYILFAATPPVHYCVGCFGCWIRTPARCVIKDRGSDFVELLALCDEFIVISRLTFGGMSPDVKAVLDRSIGVVMPYFRYIDVPSPERGGIVRETHHTKRYDKTPDLHYLFYGADMTEREKATAERLATANLINYGFGRRSAGFYLTADECAAAIGDLPPASDIAQAAAGRAEEHSFAPNTEARRAGKIAFINGSPKRGKSASWIISGAIAEKIGDAADCVFCNAANQERAEIIEAMSGCDALVFVFPLYVDGIPSHLLRLLDEAREEIAAAAPGATVYVAMNNGFYEGHQNILAFEMMRSFAARAGLAWGRALGIGAGGMIYHLTVGKGPLKNLGNAISDLAKDIITLTSAPDSMIEPNFPRSLYKTAAHIEWRKAARKNNLTPKQLHKK